MVKNAWWKWLTLIVLLAWSVVLVTPVKEKVKLGLDLRGGSSFILEVDTSAMPDSGNAKAVDEAVDRALEVIRNRVDGMGLAEPIIYRQNDTRIVVQLPGLKAEDRKSALENIQRAAFLKFAMVHEDSTRLTSGLIAAGKAPEGYRVTEVQNVGPDNAIRTEKLYERIESEDGPDTVRAAKLQRALKNFNAPVGYEMVLEPVDIGANRYYQPYFVQSRMRGELTGEFLEDADVDQSDPLKGPQVSLKFDSEGARRFSKLTGDYAPGGPKNMSSDRRQLAIILDDTLYSAPAINEAIYGGSAVISGSFSIDEANDLALVLRAGSLPVPVKVLEERGVDPTLGRDSISSGTRAAIWGALAVLVFMVFYYLLCGVVADMALLLDMLLLPAGMWLVSGFMGTFTGAGGGAGLPVLTLPGIAGIVLTIGMAVDANVLIFERMREEFAVGKSFKGAVSAGYEKAFSTIFDANLTTLLTAIILFWQGSGPIRGFAVTLSAGIVVSMFVVLVITRLFFDLLAEHSKVQTLKMLQLVKETSIDFVGKRKFAAFVSVALIIITWASFAFKGDTNFGVDFTGGSAVTFGFEQPAEVEAVRDSLAEAGIDGVQIQYQKELGVQKFLQITVKEGQEETLRETLLSKFADEKFHVIKNETISGQIGNELKRRAVTAVLFALVGIIIYITVRFEFSFAMGAIVALAHDVLITIGLYCMLGRQLSLPIVAALLTVVGYSVNDTIVVFDRIREDLKLIKGKPYSEIANLSINQTLSRTLLTSVTTLITVLTLLVFGGGAINDFALALFIGILVGTYSSIFVATPVVLLWHKDKKTEA